MINYVWHSDEKRILHSQIERLIPFLSRKKRLAAFDVQQYERCLANPLFFTKLAVDDEKPPLNDIVGMASIFYQHNWPNTIAEIHDVVVEDAYKGKGIGRHLMEELCRHAQWSADYLQQDIKLSLTSGPDRVTANALYLKIGFMLAATAHGENGTNLYKMTIHPKTEKKDTGKFCLI